MPISFHREGLRFTLPTGGWSAWRGGRAAFSATAPERDGFRCDYGFRLRRDRSNFYREAADLLGAVFAYNRDPFHRGWKATCGNRDEGLGPGDPGTDYDYDILRREAVLFGAGHYRYGRFGLSFGAELSFADLRRVGHYEKATLPGSRSYGSSAVCGFTPYNVYVSARYGFTARHRLRAEVFAGEYIPCYEDIFLSPDYSNALAGGIRSERVAGVQAEYRVPLACSPWPSWPGTSYIRTAPCRWTAITTTCTVLIAIW